MVSGWKQRRHEEREPAYGESKLFTVELHYGGHLEGWGYHDGDVAWFDYVDPERFSLMELNRMVVGLLRREAYMQYLWVPDGKDLNEGSVPIYNDEDVGEMVSGRKEGRVQIYIRLLTEDEVEDLVNAHVEAVQIEIANSNPQSGVRIEEIEEDEEAQQATIPVLGKRKMSETPRTPRLLLEWREVGSTPVVNNNHAEKSGVSPNSPVLSETTPGNPNADRVGTEEAIDYFAEPVVTDWDEEGHSDDSSLDLTDSDVDIYDDIDVQERFELDKLWQDSETRHNETREDSESRQESVQWTDDENRGSGVTRGSGERSSDKGSDGSGPRETFLTNPDPHDVDSDMETDDAGFSKRLVFYSDEEDDYGGVSYPEFNRELNLDNPEFQNGICKFSGCVVDLQN